VSHPASRNTWNISTGGLYFSISALDRKNIAFTHIRIRLRFYRAAVGGPLANRKHHPFFVTPVTNAG
jgi:hypothetical protein